MKNKYKTINHFLEDLCDYLYINRWFIFKKIHIFLKLHKIWTEISLFVIFCILILYLFPFVILNSNFIINNYSSYLTILGIIIMILFSIQQFFSKKKSDKNPKILYIYESIYKIEYTNFQNKINIENIDRIQHFKEEEFKNKNLINLDLF